MAYVTSVPVIFPLPADRVYSALRDLSLYPLWNSGMLSISSSDMLTEGMKFKTESTAAGRVNKSEVLVTRLIPDQEIELVSETGLITYRAVFKLGPVEPNSTEVLCVLKFEFNNFVLKMARPVLESMAQARVKGDLEALRALLQGEY